MWVLLSGNLSQTSTKKIWPRPVIDSISSQGAVNRWPTIVDCWSLSAFSVTVRHRRAGFNGVSCLLTWTVWDYTMNTGLLSAWHSFENKKAPNESCHSFTMDPGRLFHSTGKKEERNPESKSEYASFWTSSWQFLHGTKAYILPKFHEHSSITFE